MILVSNNILKYDPDLAEKKNLTIRVNVAWFRDVPELRETLDGLKGKGLSVFLDFPEGRSKPPTPRISLGETLGLLKEYDNIRYFAVSNAETPERMHSLMKELNGVTLVPKIESAKGIMNIEGIVKSAGTDMVMLDKEDLYSDTGNDGDAFLRHLADIRKRCRELNVRLLELQGVAFSFRKDEDIDGV